jgi:hypothetical protein
MNTVKNVACLANALGLLCFWRLASLPCCWLF